MTEVANWHFTVDKPNFQFVFEWLLTEDELLGEGVEQLRAAE